MQFGDYCIEIIPDTEFWLDGGAMFGIVPRVLWERVSPPDELNRVRLNMNCLFVETRTERILIETGIGEKWSEKETAMYGIRRTRPFADSLYEITGYHPADISIVINTHLHFDHAGGNTITEPPAPLLPEEGWPEAGVAGVSGGLTSAEVAGGLTSAAGSTRAVPQFPNARYFVSEAEFEHATSPHERDRTSYRSENWQPLVESGQLELKPASYEAIEGLFVEEVRGHSETMQTIRLVRGGKTLFGFYDMVPTRHHIPLAWIMSYDLYPTETLEFKKQVLPRAASENWTCLFYHDPDQPLGRITNDNGRYKAVTSDE
jgi:glyoxylase-like metal-dependent hydrolase (beta-lactamase superfamily II)